MVRLYYSASILAGRASAPYMLPPYIHLCTYTVYTCILEAYTVYCTDHMLSK